MSFKRPLNVAVPLLVSAVVLLSLCGTAAAQNNATCDGLDEMIDRIPENLMTCTRNSECDMVNCTGQQLPALGYDYSMTLLSCFTPPAIQLAILHNSAIIYMDIISETTDQMDLGNGLVIIVTLVQLEEQQEIGIGVTVVTFFGDTDIIPYSEIPLDTQSCIISSIPVPFPSTRAAIDRYSSTLDDATTYIIDFTTVPIATTEGVPTVFSTTTSPNQLPSTQVLTPTPYSTPVVEDENTTCSVLEKMAAEAGVFDCTADAVEPCDEIDCLEELFGSNYSVVITLRPCTNPTSFTLVMAKEGSMILDETISKSENITVEDLFNVLLVITLDHFEDAIGMKIDAYLLSNVNNIIKYTVIPLERSKHCTDNKATTSSGRLETMAKPLPLLIALIVLIASNEALQW